MEFSRRSSGQGKDSHRLKADFLLLRAVDFNQEGHSLVGLGSSIRQRVAPPLGLLRQAEGLEAFHHRRRGEHSKARRLRLLAVSKAYLHRADHLVLRPLANRAEHFRVRHLLRQAGLLPFKGCLARFSIFFSGNPLYEEFSKSRGNAGF